MKRLGYFEVPITVYLSAAQRQKANRLLNEHFTGKATVEMEQEVAEAHVDAAFAVNRSYAVIAEVAVLADGRLEVARIRQGA